MTAKEYLSQGFHVNKDINEKVLELESLDSEICRCTQSFSDTPPIEHNDNKTEIELADYIDKHKELVDIINAETDELLGIQIDTRKRILKLCIPRHRLILMKRYWRFLKWEKIQEEMGYLESKSVHRVHNEAVKEFIKIHGNSF